LQKNPADPQKPWNIVFFHDEISAGNILKADNKKKCVAVYFSFVELGQSLRHESAWLCLAAIPSELAHRCRGGLSCIVKYLLRLFFFGSPNFCSGVAIPLETPVLLFAKLGNVLGDEAGLKATYCSKGTSGVKPCLLCKNVINKGELCLYDATNYLVSISCCNTCSFDRATDDEIWAIVDQLGASSSHLPKSQFSDLEKAAGFNNVEDGLLRKVLSNTKHPKAFQGYV
jgi:hypothetical protein